MSASAELQKLVRTLLITDATIAGMIDDRVFDDRPEVVTYPFITFGPSDVVDDGADCIASGEHTLQLDIWSRASGHVEAKRIVDAVKKCLHEREASLEENALVGMFVDFRRVFDDPDGKTKHGVVTLRAMVEEAG